MTRRPPWTWELEGRLALALILLTMTAFALPRPLYPAAQSGPRAPTDRERLEALVAEGERLQ
ncbi:MAG: hypothetical protein HYY42_04460 [Chloroflexi bacterium]|nr:hypothetical protein [Chloroflexota bacterium]